MFTLIAMGIGVAWVYSVVATVAPGPVPAAFRDADGAVAVYFEAAAVITVLVLLGQVLELRAREQTGGAIRALLDLAPKTARRIRADGSDEDVALEAVAVGDRLRVRPGEKVPVDGEIVEGAQRDRRVDGHRRIDAGRPRAPATASIGGTINQTGAFVMRAEQGRARHGAGADRPDGGRGAAQPRADPAPRRSGGGLVRAAGDRRRRARLRRLGDVRPGAALRLRPCRGGVGADHRLSLRARACDADVDHGRRRPRRAVRRADQERRSARALREGRHAGRRQDRHADRRQAGSGRGQAGVAERGRSAAARRQPRSVGANIRWPRRSSRAAKKRGLALAKAEEFDAPAGKGVVGTVEGRARHARQRRDHGAPRDRRERDRRPRPTRCAARARRRSSSRSTAKRRASSPSPIRSRRRRRTPCAPCARRACASSC